MKILVVDDEPDLSKLLMMNLKLSGYEVIIAADGEEGINKTVSEKPDLIILDIEMPVINGWEVCETLKSNENTKNIPIIMCSAKDSVSDAEKSFKLGAQGYIPKPVNLNRMLTKIKEFAVK